MNKLVVEKNDLINNLQIINTLKNEKTKIIAVVKGNGMGLGLVELSRFLIENGIKILGVATPEEAYILREAGISEEILLFTPVNDLMELKKLIENKITLTLSSIEQVKLIESIECENVNAHIKIDTGFARYGFLYYNEKEILECINLCKKIKITRNIYTFFKGN